MKNALKCLSSSFRCILSRPYLKNAAFMYRDLWKKWLQKVALEFFMMIFFLKKAKDLLAKSHWIWVYFLNICRFWHGFYHFTLKDILNLKRFLLFYFYFAHIVELFLFVSFKLTNYFIPKITIDIGNFFW